MYSKVQYDQGPSITIRLTGLVIHFGYFEPWIHQAQANAGEDSRRERL